MNNDQPSSSARTDDLLASGPDSKDGAQGFDHPATPGALKTGMEGIAGSTESEENTHSDSQESASQKQTLPDNPGQVRNGQES